MDFNISCDKLIIVGYIFDCEDFVKELKKDSKYYWLEVSKPTFASYKYRYCCKAPNLVFFYCLNHNEKFYHSQIKIVYNPNKPYKRNPNSSDEYDSDEFFEFLLGRCRKYALRECDVACDYRGIERDRCYFMNSPYCKYSYIRDYGVTEYSGRHHTHGFTKLYDKQKESKLDYKCVRLEYTFTKREQLPFVPYFNYIAETSDSENALLQLMFSAGSPAYNKYINSLTYKTKRKYLDLINKEYFSSLAQYELIFNKYLEMFDKYTFGGYVSETDVVHSGFYFTDDESVKYIFEK